MKFFIVILLILFSIGEALSQDQLFRRYATQSVHQRLKSEHPTLASQQSNIERFLEEQKKKLRFKKVTIPVVFHIIYTPGQAYPSEEQVYTQIEALNRDFSKRAYRIQHPADTLEGFSRKAEDMEIEFCLAKEGPTGAKEPAIRFIPSASTRFKDDDLIKTQRFGSPAWDTERYLNVWVAAMVDSVSGYAQMPGGPPETDGIVIDYRYFGTIGTARAPYNEGKTLTHLVGNYLGLFDLWGEYPCGDDYVEDTPIHNSPNSGCPKYKHVSLCEGYPVEMTMNFMDNTNDACLYMFTFGQKVRMQAVLSENGPRSGLIESEVKCANKDNLDINPRNTLNNNLNSIPIVKFYPNPAHSEIRILVTSLIENHTKITAFSTLGAIQWQQSFDLILGNHEFVVDCSNWLSGSYFFKVETEQNSFTHHIVVIRN